jgi:hypothetical protein
MNLKQIIEKNLPKFVHVRITSGLTSVLYITMLCQLQSLYSMNINVITIIIIIVAIIITVIITILNDKLGKMAKKVTEAYFKILFQHLPAQRFCNIF